MNQNKQTVHNRRSYAGAIFVAALLALPAAADTVTVYGEKLNGVIVTGYADGKLTYRQKGETVTVPITMVQQIELGGESEFNRAENLAAKGDKGMVAAYEQAVKKVKGTWRPALAKRRLAMAYANEFPVPVVANPNPKPKPAPAPTTRPTSQPASAPAKETPKDDEDAEPPIDLSAGALATVHHLLAACGEMPADPRQSAHWPDLDEEHQAQAVQQYERDMKHWNATYDVRGKTVTWTLPVASLTRERNRRVVLGLRGGGQITVRVTLSAAASAGEIPKFEDGDKARVTGTLREFVYTPGEKTIFTEVGAKLSVTIDEAYLGDKPPEEKKE